MDEMDNDLGQDLDQDLDQAGEETEEIESAESSKSSGGGRNITTIIIAALVGFLLLVACGVFAFLLLRGGSETAETPTLAATAGPLPDTPTAEPTDEAVAVDETWSRIQESGKLVVGTSADYPPFEFYTQEFQIDGFDVALMNDIGQKLGLTVEVKDFAFDGLGGALLSDQVDTAIAAISVSEQREQAVNFTNIYFVSEDAVLATADAEVTVTSVEELVTYRVGVQNGSVYNDWLQDLVDAGVMRQRNLHTYQEAGHILDDLDRGFIDVGVVDKPPAELAVETGSYKIVGGSLNRQRMAIAAPKEAPVLLAQLNGALLELQNEGRITELAEEYMNLTIGEIIPVPTPDPSQPTPTPVPPIAGECSDALAYVADITIDDMNMSNPPVMAPGQPFTKVWRVQNVGTCTWDNTYKLTYAGGNSPLSQMGGQPVFVDRLVQPGAEYDISLDLIAPTVPGIYQGFWQMHNGDNEGFGQKLWVGITVPAAPTVTPMPTQTPSPNIQFTVSNDTITQGECVVFAWSVENVQAVYFYANGENWWENGVPGQGTSTECPIHTTTYNLRVVFNDGSIAIPQITVNVTNVPGAPVISQFSVTPSQILLGQCVDITWRVEGQVDRITIKRDNTTLWDFLPVSGTRQDCPPNSGTVAYTIDATGTGGTSRLQRNVSVLEPAAPTPTNTPIVPLPTNTPAPILTSTPIPTPTEPVPRPPTIDRFSVDPNEIQPGESVGISWQVSGNTDLIQLKRNGRVILDNAPPSGITMDVLNEPGIYTYSIDASNNQGQSDTAQDIVEVSSEGGDNPLAGTSWSLVSMLIGGQQTPLLEGTSITASFDAAGIVSGSSGCNSYTAPYTVSGSSITMGPASGSQIFCEQPQGIMEQENNYLTQMNSAASYELGSGQLLIKNSKGQTLFTYTALAATPTG
jgi:polar amino acid transport system substrate-binding protein